MPPEKQPAARDHGVQLPADTTASGLLHRLLVDARHSFEDLAPVAVPEDAKAFRRSFAAVLPRFEAHRAASPRRSEIARHVVKQAARALVFRRPDGEDVPLATVLAEGARPLPTRVREGTGSDHVLPSVHWRDGSFEGAGVRELADRLLELHLLTEPAAAALRWMADYASAGLDLSDHKFVVMGAGAELAPTAHLLAAGATVLWIDVVEPKLPTEAFSGTLHFVPDGADLLAQPAEIVATIEAFAEGDPVHVGMFAYAAGHGREWRLEAAMNAIARALTRERLASISIYVSPTSAIVSHPDDARLALERPIPIWQRPLARFGALRENHVRVGEVAVAQAIVQLQGASYQAAQYVAKILAAEAFACAPDASRRVPIVSANVAGITNTSSMSEPVFQAGFAGAWHFGDEIFEPRSTRWLAALLMLHDLLAPDARLDPAHPERLFHRQIHGGVYTSRWRLEDAIRVAALIGVAKRPALIPAFFRR